MGQPFIGEIRIFGGNFAPVGWAFCSGQLLAIDQNSALFQLIGTTYGGDGQTTFALPNLQSRFPIHQGQGTGLTNRIIGETAGAESVTLTLAQLPAHAHVPVSAGAGTQASPVGGVWAAAPAGGKLYSNVAHNTTMNAAALVNTGGGQPHENRPPLLALNFIIALEGIFPSQN